MNIWKKLKQNQLTLESLIGRKLSAKQRRILTSFRKAFPDCDLHIREHLRYYEIVVQRHSETTPEKGLVSAGAEQYFLDKKTGLWKMGWHEHPMYNEKF